VEDVVETGARWKLQAHSHVVDELDDAVGPHVSGFELACRRARQGRRSTLPKAEKCPVPDLVLHQPVVLVVVELLNCLGLLELVAYIGEESFARLHLLGDRFNSRLTRLIRADGGRITAVDDPERRVAER
jgi:hypothetical protein